jgi:hypothetical protein
MKGWKCTNVLKQCSFIHCQNLIRHAWYTARLTSIKVFCSGHEPKFHAEKTTQCKWSKEAFVTRSWCYTFFKFSCIYNEHYPESCKPVILVWFVSYFTMHKIFCCKIFSISVSLTPSPPEMQCSKINIISACWQLLQLNSMWEILTSDWIIF